MKLSITIRLNNYIAHPYWTAKDDVINLEKKSGMNRAKSESKRDASLSAYLKQEGMTRDEFDELKRKSGLEWYRLDENDSSSPITIPRHCISAALVGTLKFCPSSVRGKLTEGNCRSKVQISDFVSDRTEADGIFDRYVKGETSNQRRRSKNEYLENVEFVGTLNVHDSIKKENVETLLEYCLAENGLGACRKMGYGMGELVRCEVQ